MKLGLAPTYTRWRQWGSLQGETKPSSATASTQDELFDQLSYTYADAGGVDAGPYAKKVYDSNYRSRGHKRNYSTSGYSFNTNGDNTYDPYRALRFEYNVFGLAKTIKVAWGVNFGARLEYRYSGDGTLRMATEYNKYGEEVSRVHYIDGMRVDVVKDEVYIPNESGAVVLDAANSATDIYYQSDHLGNIMLAYRDADGDGVINTASAEEILEESRYFPYGYKQEAYTRQSASVPFAFNGAEEIEGYGLHLTTFRTMAPETALWGQVDPKAAADFIRTPYAVNGSNPISNTDPLGDLFFVIPQIGIGSDGVSIGVEIGIGIPGGLSASATVGASRSGAYWSAQGSAAGFYAGYGSNGGFAGFGFRHAGVSAGIQYGAGGLSVSVGFGGGLGNGYTVSAGVGYGAGGFTVGGTTASRYMWGKVESNYTSDGIGTLGEADGSDVRGNTGMYVDETEAYNVMWEQSVNETVETAAWLTDDGVLLSPIEYPASGGMSGGKNTYNASGNTFYTQSWRGRPCTFIIMGNSIEY